MPRVKIGPALPDRGTVAVEIAQLRDLDISELRNRWHTVFGRRPPVHLPRHLLFRVLAYRVQADHFGDLDSEYQRLLDRSKYPEEPGQRATDLGGRTAELRPGTVLGREWNGRMHRVAVLAEGFAWNGQTYPSLNGTNLTKVDEAKIGKWAQGAAWSRDGKSLLAQSMVDNALSILSFDGNSLKITGQIKVKGGPAGVCTENSGSDVLVVQPADEHMRRNTSDPLNRTRYRGILVQGPMCARRQLLWFAVTRHPTAVWLAQQIVEAFPWETAPTYLVRDNDGACGPIFRRRVRAMGIRDRPISPARPGRTRMRNG